jgi:hypothetical protein
MADEPPKVDLEKLLREAKPPWMTEGGGIRGPNPRRIGGPPAAEVAGGRFPIKIEQSLEAPPFPQLEPVQQITEESEEQSAQTNEYSFELEVGAPKGVKAIDKEAGTVKIHVGYGEIGPPGNTEPPDGMTGADDYYLTISVDGTEIYAIVTYDTSTLVITSRSLAFGVSVPDSTFGTLYIPIGSVDIAYDDSGKIKEVNPHNRQCGDMVFVLTYGDVNGVPAVIPVCAYAPLVAVT